MNLSGPPMSSSSALNVSSYLASSSSGPQQLVHIPLSPRLSSNIPSRNCSPLSNLFNLPVQSEIPWKTECVQSLKDKERKKQKEAVQKALHFEVRLQKKNQREEELCRNSQKEKQLWWKKKWPRLKEKLLNYK